MVFKFQCMVYEKHELLIKQKKSKLWNEWHFMENETAIMHHALNKVNFLAACLNI